MLSTLLQSHVSPRELADLAHALGRLDRRPGGPGLERACELLAAELERAGAHAVELRRYPIGPEQRDFEWSAERPPHPDEAELWLLGEDGRRELLCRASEDPRCLVGALRATAPDGEVFEVVEVGGGTRPDDYRGHRLDGRIALARGRHRQAVALEALAVRGAAGLLLGPAHGPLRPFGGDVLALPALHEGRRPFAFQLDEAQLARLTDALADGGARVLVRLGTTIASGELPLVSATLDGSDLAAERVLLLADLATSTVPAACLHQLLRLLSTLITQRRTSPPRRTIELLFVPGAHGTVAWLAREGRRPAAALQLGPRQPGLAWSRRDPLLRDPPESCPSFLGDLLAAHFAGRVERWPYGPGSAAAPLIDRDVAVPTVWLAAAPAETAVAVDPAATDWARPLIAGLGAAVLDLASVDEADLPRLFATSQLDGIRRLTGRAEQLLAQMRDELRELEPSSAARHARHLRWLAETTIETAIAREEAVLGSSADFMHGVGGEALRLAEARSDLRQTAAALLRSLEAELASYVGPRTRLSVQRRPATALERRADRVVVTRCCEGPPPPLLSELALEDRPWLAQNAVALASQPIGELLLQWVDGERTVCGIWQRLALDHPQADLALLWRYLEVLERAGLVRLATRPDVSAAG